MPRTSPSSQPDKSQGSGQLSVQQEAQRSIQALEHFQPGVLVAEFQCIRPGKNMLGDILKDEAMSRSGHQHIWA